ncbi:poly(3-hydroxybutyrate) depolymerase [Haematobacter missouriensis]|uniref:Phage portal protein n=1 Tax=Haematobacter missouriensis TaxID=366616 RepID=A0A212AQU4_9RHOB|nr:phage portal protein [Haematobacter missouriensis]KFI30967.1 poly(3-hydroxybutyrate) depolymerase [Haematobacter missouriensis]OWJ73889.1 phage portal protein [Haematobacter missouriensis]OWJ83815.1 phage portal protein [Haematobacter missouriensis]
MRLFGLTITRKSLSPVTDNRGWFPLIREPFTGGWQQNAEVKVDTVLSNPTIFACMTLIAGDISKLRIKLMEYATSGVWQETRNNAYSPVLRKPNRYQTRGQFVESWILSKLSRGNTFVLKQRDNRGVVTALYVLDPNRVKPLVSDDGSVYYELQPDTLTASVEAITVPASEVIHDRYNCLFHPLVGLSPIFAAGLAAMQGYQIANGSTLFFRNRSMPSGILIAPGPISDATATRLKSHWETDYTGSGAGKIAVVGDGLKFEPLGMTAVDAQLVDQLKWSDEVIARTFHIPPYKIGLEQTPVASNVQALNVEYYSRALQKLIEDAEACLDEGLSLDGVSMGVEFDTDGLLRMDSVAQMEVIERSKNVLTLDERRKRLDAPPITGGDTVYMQEQDHSIAAINARDQMLIDQSEAQPFALPAPEAPADEDPELPDEAGKALWEAEFRKAVGG